MEGDGAMESRRRRGGWGIAVALMLLLFLASGGLLTFLYRDQLRATYLLHRAIRGDGDAADDLLELAERMGASGYPYLTKLAQSDSRFRFVPLRSFAWSSQAAPEPAILSALESKNEDVRWWALVALPERDDPHIDLIVAKLGDPSKRVGLLAVMSLESLVARFPLDERLHRAFREAMLGNADLHVRAAAAFALGRLRDENAVPDLILATEDAEREGRLAAAIALGQIGAQEAKGALRRMLRKRMPEGPARQPGVPSARRYSSDEERECAYKVLQQLHVAATNTVDALYTPSSEPALATRLRLMDLAWALRLALVDRYQKEWPGFGVGEAGGQEGENGDVNAGACHLYALLVEGGYYTPAEESVAEAPDGRRYLVDGYGQPFAFIGKEDYGRDFVYEFGDRQEAISALTWAGDYLFPNSFQLWSVGENGLNEDGEGDDLTLWGIWPYHDLFVAHLKSLIQAGGRDEARELVITYREWALKTPGLLRHTLPKKNGGTDKGPGR